MLKISYTINNSLQQKPDFDSLGFGKYHTDYMLMADYANGVWQNHRIVPFAPLELHPFATGLHYGAQVFEGLKAYCNFYGDVQLFRPLENIKRLNKSANRLCLPQIESDDFMQMLTEFVKLEKDWVPTKDGTSLYLRPLLIGTDDTLGVNPPKKAQFVLMASPVGAYYTGGLKPVKILIELKDVRAAVGGTGHVKAGGNYASSLRATKRALKNDYNQILWLDAKNRAFIEEVGAMNVFFVINNQVLTPSLNGSILPGITRDSCLQILKSKNINVCERQISLYEILQALKKGTISECFGTGTAAVVSPVGTIGSGDKMWHINNKKIGKITQLLYDTLTGIQFGKAPDTFNWTHKI